MWSKVKIFVRIPSKEQQGERIFRTRSSLNTTVLASKIMSVAILRLSAQSLWLTAAMYILK